MWPKNMWKRIPHLMQQHKTRGKDTTGQYTINTLQDKISHTKITKEKENRVNTTTAGPTMT